MITIDGSFGEGGGQVLRTSLALSLVTEKPFRIEKIRSGRKRPGLLRQHLAAVRAAEQIGQAKVDGAAIGSKALTFQPAGILPGEYRFAVGSAGSATLVLQAVLPALILSGGRSRLTLEGGTHNPFAPPFDFLHKTLLPVINRMGPRVEATLRQAGFYPAGGGCFTVDIEPADRLTPIDLRNRGKLASCAVRAIVSRLPVKIAQREVETVANQMGWSNDCLAAEEVRSPGPGNAVMIEIQSEHVTEVFTGFGQRGVPAERVAAETAKQASRYLVAGAAVGKHLADQLLIPMALAGGGSFQSLPTTLHTRTNAEIIRRFVDVAIHVEPIAEDVCQINVG